MIMMVIYLRLGFSVIPQVTISKWLNRCHKNSPWITIAIKSPSYFLLQLPEGLSKSCHESFFGMTYFTRCIPQNALGRKQKGQKDCEIIFLESIWLTMFDKPCGLRQNLSSYNPQGENNTPYHHCTEKHQSVSPCGSQS